MLLQTLDFLPALLVGAYLLAEISQHAVSLLRLLHEEALHDDLRQRQPARLVLHLLLQVHGPDGVRVTLLLLFQGNVDAVPEQYFDALPGVVEGPLDDLLRTRGRKTEC